jgi:signal transduction histidine kinase
MSRRPMTVRVFLAAAILALTVLPVATGSAAWLIERHRQEAEIQQRLRAATAYLTAHRERVSNDEKTAIFELKRRLQQLDFLAQFGVIDKSLTEKKAIGEQPIYTSPALEADALTAKSRGLTEEPKTVLPAGTDPKTSTSWRSENFTIPLGAPPKGAAIVGTLYYRPPDLTTRALFALAAAVLVLLAGLAITVWLAGRWIVKPLSRLSNEVDKIAGGDLAVAAPHTRISEVANVAAAIDGMATALGETGQQQAAADEARRFLVTAVAHDLRTPLFALRGHLEAIADELGDAAEHLARAKDRAASLERLIASLFTYARHDYAPQEPLLEDVLLGELISGIAAGFRRGAFLLDGDDDVAVVADRERLERVLENVFDNALRHSPPGIAVEVAWSERGSEVEVTIADQGPGIDADLLPQIFQPMVRGDRSRNSSSGGAGLGLTIAKRLIESQHGTIAARNRPDGGAEFTVMLRRAEPTDREAGSAIDVLDDGRTLPAGLS